MYILSLDQGTTSSRAILFDKEGNIKSVAQKEFTQIYTGNGYIEHDPNEIWSSQIAVAAECIAKAGAGYDDIAALGITNQRETTIMWDKNTGEPVYNAIVWQCRRTEPRIMRMQKDGYDLIARQRTGLIADPYFSATKLEWILDNVEGARQRAENGELLFGTVDTWLVWKLTGGKAHITDRTNASRTMLYNIHKNCWDKELLGYFNIPECMLPDVVPSYGELAVCDPTVIGAPIKICGIAGDQQAALFGQGCFSKGDVKNTYGTGCFMLMNTGDEAVDSKNGLLTTIAATGEGEICYALEGSVFVAGAAIQWLRDEMKILDNAKDSEAIATSVRDSEGVVVVPTFAGMGTPYWNSSARGCIFGIHRGTNRAHIIRATLESLALQSYDVLKAMESDCNITIRSLKVDGGASANNFLMQIQSDLLYCDVVRPEITESTALGAARLAMLGCGMVKDKSEFSACKNTVFTPRDIMDTYVLKTNWERAINAALTWAGR